MIDFYDDDDNALVSDFLLKFFFNCEDIAGGVIDSSTRRTAPELL